MKLDEPQALDAFAALSQETRLKMVRALVVAGTEGLAAGAVGDLVGASSSSASFHLSHLERAGLVQSRRAARSIIYTANFDGLSGPSGGLHARIEGRRLLLRCGRGRLMPALVSIPADAPELRAALDAAELPTEDIAEPGRRFFRYDDGGEPVGYGGYELHGEHTLLRS
eukprot:gene42390-57376_t